MEVKPIRSESDYEFMSRSHLVSAQVVALIRKSLAVFGLLIAVSGATFSQPALAQFSQQGPKLVGPGAVGGAYQGYSVSVSSDGNTAIVGGDADNGNAGAAWVWTRSGGVWTQQG